jgi:hypothetical protein
MQAAMEFPQPWPMQTIILIGNVMALQIKPEHLGTVYL